MTNHSQREKEILRLLAEEDDISLTELSRSLDVSTVTLRSDLNRLADKGYIMRARGAALPAFHPQILERQRCRTEQKTRIAKAAAELIEDGDHVMVSAGTTTALIGRFLLGKRDVHVVTNSTLLLPAARSNPSLQLTLVGGDFKPSAEAIVGPMALKDLEQFHVKRAFIGCDGISLDVGTTAKFIDLAEIVRQMTAQAETTAIVADSSKFGQAGFARILPLSEMDMLITDSELDASAARDLTESGLTVKAV